MANDDNALLVLGVLPSHDTRIAKTARARRDAARSSWLQNSADILTKFVLLHGTQPDERSVDDDEGADADEPERGAAGRDH